MRVAIYTRISTDEEHQSYSLEAQDLRLAAYAHSQDGSEATRRYSDRMTGSTIRPAGVPVSNGSVALRNRKALLQTLVAEIRVEGRDAIFPT